MAMTMQWLDRIRSIKAASDNMVRAVAFRSTTAEMQTKQVHIGSIYIFDLNIVKLRVRVNCW